MLTKNLIVINDLSYSTEGNLKKHVKTIHEKLAFHCAVCGNSLATRQRIKVHYSKCKAKAYSALETDDLETSNENNNLPEKNMYSKSYVEFLSKNSEPKNLL